jgi:hypothetical protein
MLGAASEAVRRVDELTASGRSLHVIMDGMNRCLQQFAEDKTDPERGLEGVSAMEAPAEVSAGHAHASDLGGRALPAREPADIAQRSSDLPLSLGITPVGAEEAELLELEPVPDDAVAQELVPVDAAVGQVPEKVAGSAAGLVAGPGSGPAPGRAAVPSAAEELEELEAADD